MTQASLFGDDGRGGKLDRPAQRSGSLVNALRISVPSAARSERWDGRRQAGIRIGLNSAGWIAVEQAKADYGNGTEKKPEQTQFNAAAWLRRVFSGSKPWRLASDLFSLKRPVFQAYSKSLSVEITIMNNAKQSARARNYAESEGGMWGSDDAELLDPKVIEPKMYRASLESDSGWGFHRRAELLNGRLAMLGFVIGVLIEAVSGQGILQQIGLGALLH